MLLNLRVYDNVVLHKLTISPEYLPKIMRNVEPHKTEKSKELDWIETPLFVRNVAPQIGTIVAEPFQVSKPPEIDDEPFEQYNVVPHNVVPQNVVPSLETKILAPLHITSTPPDKNSFCEQNGGPHQEKSAVLHSVDEEDPRQGKNVVPLDLPKIAQRKKSRKKSPVKKVRSQKRNVVPLKLFVSPAEKIDLETSARERNCSLSNYIRLNLGLAPNETGRKKQNVVAAFDLSEFDLED